MKLFMRLTTGFILALIVALPRAEMLHGHVVGVSDGDTITVLDGAKQRRVIRLMGIDAPEKAQAFGHKSKQSLSDLAFGRDVSVTWVKRDRYGRIVGQVHVDGTDVCLEQIKRGLAWHYKEYEREQSEDDRLRYAEAEEQARIARIGLWSHERPIEPRKFRLQSQR